MESGWLVSSTLSSNEGSDAGFPGRSYLISPMGTTSSLAVIGNFRPTTPHGRGTGTVRANSIVKALTYSENIRKLD